MKRALAVALVAGVAGLAVPSAGAKNFNPGDLRLCNAKRCVAILNRGVLEKLAEFYYGSYPLTGRRRPRRGAPYYQLRFRNGYVTGLVGTRRLDRFLSNGVNLDRFAPRHWYAVPRGASAELRRLAVRLRPLRL